MKIESVVVNIDWTKEAEKLYGRIKGEYDHRKSMGKASKISAITVGWLLFFAIILSFCMLFNLTSYANVRTVVGMWVMTVIVGLINCSIEVNGKKDFYSLDDTEFEEVFNYVNTRKTDFVTKEYARMYLFGIPHLDLVSSRILLSKAVLAGKCSIDYDDNRITSAVKVCVVESLAYDSFDINNNYLVNPHLNKEDNRITIEFTIREVNVYQNVISQDAVKATDVNYTIKKE